MSDRRRLEEALAALRPDDFATVAGLLSHSWQRHVRILHPAARVGRPGERVPVPWAEVASRTWRPLDIATSRWADVAAVEPHTADLPPGVDVEPREGPKDEHLQASVFRALRTAGGDARLELARWVGYNDDF